MLEKRIGAGLLGLMFVSQALGQVVHYEQPVTLLTGFMGFTSTPGGCVDQQLADDVTFVASTTVTTVTWWGWTEPCGGATQSAADGIDSFTVTFFSDTGGNVPDVLVPPIYKETFTLAQLVNSTPAFFTSPTGISGSGADVFIYTVNLRTPAVLPAGQLVWISISANTTTSEYFWSLEGTGLRIPESVGSDKRARRNIATEFAWRLSIGGHAFRLTQNIDTDSDGLPDEDEILFGTDPNDPDTDGDGLLDGIEVDLADGSGCPNPLIADSDSDGLLDGFEVNQLGTSPCNDDTNGNGILDATDPFPAEPATTSELINYVQEVSETFLAIETARYLGPNTRAQLARQKVLAARMDEAASLISQGLNVEALDVLNSVLDRVDNDPSPPDWLSGAERETMEILVFIAIFNLSL